MAMDGRLADRPRSGFQADSHLAYLELAARTSAVFFVLDEHLRYVCWNAAAEQLTGILAWQVVGRSFYEVFPEAAHSAAEGLYLGVLRTGQPMTLPTDDGGDERFEVIAWPLGEGLCVLALPAGPCSRGDGPDWPAGSAPDSFLDRSPVAACLVGDGAILRANPAFRRLFGYVDPLRCLGSSLLGHIRPADRGRVAGLVREGWLARPMAHSVRVTAHRQDGQTLAVDMAGGPIHTPRGLATLVFLAQAGPFRLADQR